VGVTPAGAVGAHVLETDGYRVVDPVPTRDDDFDAQGHLNNAATVRLFNDLRIAYVHGRVGPWWPEAIRANGYVIAAREVHVLYESEGRPGEHFVGGMKYVGRDGKAAVLEQRIVETTTGRAIARAWVVQLLVQDGRVVDWPQRYFDRVAEIEGRAIPPRPRSEPRPWGPPGMAGASDPELA
jgi:acyl-CoA thioesterase FadM